MTFLIGAIDGVPPEVSPGVGLGGVVFLTVVARVTFLVRVNLPVLSSGNWDLYEHDGCWFWSVSIKAASFSKELDVGIAEV